MLMCVYPALLPEVLWMCVLQEARNSLGYSPPGLEAEALVTTGLPSVCLYVNVCVYLCVCVREIFLQQIPYTETV